MFSIKKAVRKVQATFEPAPVMVTAKQVHEDFYREASSLLLDIDLEVKVAAKRFDDLVSIGMRKVADFEDCETAKDKVSSVELAKYYADKYPKYKFLSYRQIEFLCKKYGLLLGETWIYKGDIPASNLKDLDITLDLKDYNCIYIEYHGRSCSIDFCIENYGKEPVEKILAGQKAVLFTITESRCYNGPVNGYILAKNPGNYKIAATPDMFDMENKKIVSGYQIVDKDPIVFHEVNGGYLIITAWGDEASIPEIVNEKYN